MTYLFIQSHRSSFPVKKMCEVLKVTRSGYYRWTNGKESPRKKKNRLLLVFIRMIHKKSRETYGSPRITEVLHDLEISCSRPRVARIMSINGIKAKMKRKFKVTTKSDHNYPISPNLLNRDFSALAANKVWVSDITYVRTSEGWLYLTVIIDLFNRKIVGWSMSNRMTARTTVMPALIQAYKRYQPRPGLLFHSDRGVQYACDSFRKLLKYYEMVQSMSRRGDCWDNAVAESFFHTIKTELIYHEKYRIRAEARRSIFEYIEVFYNRFRKHSYLGYKTPDEFGRTTYNQAI